MPLSDRAPSAVSPDATTQQVGGGRAVYTATIIALGIMGLRKGDFTPPWMAVSKDVPAREGLAYLSALTFLIAGVGLLWRRTAAAACGALVIFLAAWLLLFRTLSIMRAPNTIGGWWALGAVSVMLASAWVLYARLGTGTSGQRFAFAYGPQGLRIARRLYGVGLIPFGVAHFTNVKETAVLVPAYLPWHMAGAYLTGAAFIAASVAIFTGVFARLATALSVLQLGLFTLLVWAPVVVAGANAFQWDEFVTSCVLTAAGYVVAQSYRGTPWLAARATEQQRLP